MRQKVTPFSRLSCYLVKTWLWESADDHDADHDADYYHECQVIAKDETEAYDKAFYKAEEVHNCWSESSTQSIELLNSMDKPSQVLEGEKSNGT